MSCPFLTLVLSWEQVEGLAQLFNSVFGSGHDAPQRLRDVEGAYGAFEAAVQSSIRDLEEVPAQETRVIALTLPEQHWAHLAAVAGAYSQAVFEDTRAAVAAALDRIKPELEARDLEPSLPDTEGAEQASPNQSQGGEGDEHGEASPLSLCPWLPEPVHARRQGLLAPETITLTWPERGTAELAWEAMVLYDAGEHLIRRGLEKTNPHEVLAGLRWLLQPELVVSERLLVGGRQRPSFEARLKALTLDASKRHGPSSAAVAFEALGKLATRVEAIGQPVMARETRNLVLELSRAWLVDFAPSWHGDRHKLWKAIQAPRRILLEALERDWRELCYAEKVDRIARALTFPWGYQNWRGSEELATWESTLFSHVAGLSGRDTPRYEMVVDIYQRTQKLTKNGEAGKLTGYVWQRMAIPHFREHWERDGRR